MDEPHTPEQVREIKAKRRRIYERRRRIYEAWLRLQEAIQRRIEEARKRRQKFLFWLLVGLIMTQAFSALFMPRAFAYRPGLTPKPPRRQKTRGSAANREIDRMAANIRK